MNCFETIAASEMKDPIPPKARNTVNSFEPGVVGVKSPYPMVEMVITQK